MAVTNETDAAILQKDLKLLEEGGNRSQMSFHSYKCNMLRVTPYIKPLILIYTTRSLRKKMQLNILESRYTIKLSWNELYAL